MILSSFGPNLRVAIFGASGALGGAFVNALAPLPAVATIYAGARSPPSGGTKIIPFSFDLLDEVAIAAVAAQVQAEGPLDLVIVATGQLHDGAAFQPEKTWRDWKPDAFARAFAVNATGPAIIAKHFLPLLAKDRRSVFAALSARVGSIEDNHLGGWAAYRASKAALHQIVRTAAIELARRNKAAFCVALHPGTVDSALSKPFQSGVAQNKLFSADQSASSMLAVLDGLEEGDSGCAFAWDGERIPF